MKSFVRDSLLCIWMFLPIFLTTVLLAVFTGVDFGGLFMETLLQEAFDLFLYLGASKSCLDMGLLFVSFFLLLILVFI